MFGWFQRTPEVREFDDNQSAFAYACTLNYPLLIQGRIPALVMEEGRPGREGERYYLLKLACRDGGLEVWGCTLADAPGHPEVGDLVSFRIIRIASELPEHASLIGFIDAQLQPVHVGKKGWRTKVSLTPASLKPELHL